MVNVLKNIFICNKPIIGMLHLDYLEGVNFKGINQVIKKALTDIETLQAGGVDGILIENWKEESLGEFVTTETKNNFTIIAKKISKHIHVPFGINVLNNDYKVAFRVAKEVGASFVELDVFVDQVRSNFQNNVLAVKKPFTIFPNPKMIWKYTKTIRANNIPLFVFVQPKHYTMLDVKKTIEVSTKQAIREGASAVIVTKSTGSAPALDLIKRVKKTAGKTPVGIGSGLNIKNVKTFIKLVDFAIVGSSLKKYNKTDNCVDLKKVKKLMGIVRSLRN